MFRRRTTGPEHQRVQDLLSAYLDGQATAQEQALVEAHLRACDACRRVWEELQATVNLVRALPQAPPPRSFTLAQAPSRGLPSFAWGPPLATAAASLVFAILVLGQVVGLLGSPSAPSPALSPSAGPEVATLQAPASPDVTVEAKAAPASTPAAPPLGIMGSQEVGTVTPTATATPVPPTPTTAPEAPSSEPSPVAVEEEAPLQAPLLPWLQGTAAALAVASGAWWLGRRRRARR